MSTIVTRAGKGSTLTFAEVDANFTNLNTDKLEFSSEPVRHSVRPSLLLDFANTKQLDPRITFTRASTATFYDGKTTAKAEENLLLRSQEFDNASWSKISATVTANTTTAPDGTTTADTLTASAATNSHLTQQAVTVLANQTYAYSIFAKYSNAQYIAFGFTGAQASNVWAAVTVDIQNGTITQTTNGGGGGVTASGTIASVGNGWYKITIIGSYNSPDTYPTVLIVNTSTPTFTSYLSYSWTAAGTETVFLWGAQLEQRSSVTAYTPTTTAAITNYIPALQTAASGVARFDHNPTTGESLGLLIEEQRVNLALRSDDFANSSWTTSAANMSVNSNAIIAPDGTLTGDTMVSTSTNGNHFLRQDIGGLTNAATYTVSICAKAGGYNRFDLLGGFSSSTGGAAFDLSTGTVTSGTGQITAIGNGWYRCSTQLVMSGTTLFLLVRGLTNAGGGTYTGDGYSGIYIWGAQLEAGAFATSYIPTVASQVTRSPDAASMTGTNFSSWYRQDAGTFYSEANDYSGINNAYLAAYADGNNIVEFRGDGSLNRARVLIRINGTFVVNTVSATSTQPIKQAASFTNGSVSSTANGALFVTNVNVQTPKLLTTLLIGEGITSAQKLNGAVKKIAYYPKSLTNAELQGLTTV